MPVVNVVIDGKVHKSVRVRQLSAMFDCPVNEKLRLSWSGDMPFEKIEPWNVGVIVGPSGSGKTQIAKSIFGEFKQPQWSDAAVVDDFDERFTMEQIAGVCQAVGFNTIPAWMRSHSKLSNGEQFRVSLARHLLEDASPIVIDEFTSVVDRQVAKIGAHAVQKYVRKTGKQFVGVSCHYDVIEWLQPDWMFEPATMTFTDRRLLRCGRPPLSAEISRVKYEAWQLFAPFHYLTAELNHAANCFALYCEGRIAAFGGVLYRPHATARNIYGLSRLVTLPDWQGLGLAMILTDALGAAYKAMGRRFRTYPAHPSLIRSFGHSPKYALMKAAGTFGPKKGRTSSIGEWNTAARPCAVFEYVGEACDKEQARQLIESGSK